MLGTANIEEIIRSDEISGVIGKEKCYAISFNILFYKILRLLISTPKAGKIVLGSMIGRGPITAASEHSPGQGNRKKISGEENGIREYRALALLGLSCDCPVAAVVRAAWVSPNRSAPSKREETC